MNEISHFAQRKNEIFTSVSYHVYSLFSPYLQENKASEESSPQEAAAGAHSFQGLVQVLPKQITRNMADNLSVPIAFVCLLHLANEKVCCRFSNCSPCSKNSRTPTQRRISAVNLWNCSVASVATIINLAIF